MLQQFFLSFFIVKLNRKVLFSVFCNFVLSFYIFEFIKIIQVLNFYSKICQVYWMHYEKLILTYLPTNRTAAFNTFFIKKINPIRKILSYEWNNRVNEINQFSQKYHFVSYFFFFESLVITIEFIKCRSIHFAIAN